MPDSICEELKKGRRILDFNDGLFEGLALLQGDDPRQLLFVLQQPVRDLFEPVSASVGRHGLPKLGIGCVRGGNSFGFRHVRHICKMLASRWINDREGFSRPRRGPSAIDETIEMSEQW